MPRSLLIAILGSTATGKSALALAIAELRRRLASIAARRDVAFLHRMVRKVDPESAMRIQPRDLKRIVRALEVFFLTGRPLTAHFANTASPIQDVDVHAIALRLPAVQ